MELEFHRFKYLEVMLRSNGEREAEIEEKVKYYIIL